MKISQDNLVITPAVTPQCIQPPTWKKHRIESPTNPSYYYTPGSAINIAAKEDLLGLYGAYFEDFKLQSPTSSGFRSPPPQPDFRTASSWEVTESERKQKKEKEESED
ncbi:hypothetical protein G9A89_018439 [Geosiphon pyriformis]|nr:hypothetical protein G9A89_018439 [Geosiphon pyriformis]